MMGDFLEGVLLLFDPVTLVSVHLPPGRMQWTMSLCASESPVLALEAEAAMLCVSASLDSSTGFSQEGERQRVSWMSHGFVHGTRYLQFPV